MAVVSMTCVSVHLVEGTVSNVSPLARCIITHAISRSQPPGQELTIPFKQEACCRSLSTELAKHHCGDPWVDSISSSCSRMCMEIAREVGCSNTSVGDSATPAYDRSRAANSVAANESSPASINGVSIAIISLFPLNSCTVRKSTFSPKTRLGQLGRFPKIARVRDSKKAPASRSVYARAYENWRA